MNKYFRWVDTVKGWGIFLVVLGHNSIPPSIFGYIYSFHIPLFFFLAGFLFGPERYPKFSGFVWKKIQTLILPYFLLFFLVYVYWAIVVEKVWLNAQNVWNPFAVILYSSTRLDSIFIPFWFLPCLFLVEIIFYLIFQKARRIYILLVLLLALAGYMISLYFKNGLPWSIDTALIALIFYGGGFYLAGKEKLKVWVSKQKSFLFPILAVLAIGINYWLFVINGRVDMLHNVYQNFIYFLLGAFAGLLGYTILIWLADKKAASILAPLNFIGQNSLIIFLLHPIGIAIGRSLFNLSEQSLFSGILYTLFTLIILWPVIHIINRYMPWFFGRLKKKPMVS